MPEKSQYHDLIQSALSNAHSSEYGPPLDILANRSNEELSKHWVRFPPTVEMFERNLILFYKVFKIQRNKQEKEGQVL